jgi:hypothetical protein
MVIGEGDAEPRFAVVGVEGEDVKVKFYKTHLRKCELEAIAQSVGAELVWLPKEEGKHKGGAAHGGKRHSHRQTGVKRDVETT